SVARHQSEPAMRDRTPTVAIVRVPDWPDAWTGWRFANDRLVSPDGDRISPERLAGLLWRQAQESRRDALRARRKPRGGGLVTVLRVHQADWHRERYGSSAG